MVTFITVFYLSCSHIIAQLSLAKKSMMSNMLAISGYYFIGNGVTSGPTDNVIFGLIKTDLTLNWQQSYTGSKTYSFEMDEDKNYLYFIVNYNSEMIFVKHNATNGNFNKAISVSSNLCTTAGCRMKFDKDQNYLYISGLTSIFKTNKTLDSGTQYTITNVAFIDQIMRISDSNYYLSSYDSGNYKFMMFSYGFSFQWGKSIACTSCNNYLQPVDSDSDSIYLLLFLNSNAVYITLNKSDGSFSSGYTVSSSTCSWVSFIYESSSRVILSFEETSSLSVIVIYQSSTFTRYEFTTGINIFGYSSISGSSSSSSQ